MNRQSVISRRMSQSAVIQAIASCAPVSRSAVSKMTGLSKQTVSEIVANLEGKGWLKAVGQTEGHIGRRAVVYEISPTAATIMSIDLGGTKIRVALCDMTGNVLSEHSEPTNSLGGMHVIEQIANIVNTVFTNQQGCCLDPHIVVIGVPGALDPQSGIIHLAPNIAGFDHLNIATLLREQLGIEVLIENDVNLAALGEHWLGNFNEADNLAYISIGTGIGAGIVVGGKLLRGSFGAAGEIGYLPFGADPFETESLKTGALERVAAKGAIESLYYKLSGKKTDVPTIFDAANNGEIVANKTLDAVAKQIARATVAIVSIVDPKVVVIGGSIGLRDELLERIIKLVSLCHPRKVEIRKTQLGDYAALAGGASIALSNLHISVFTEGQKGPKISVPPPAIENFMAVAS